MFRFGALLFLLVAGTSLAQNEDAVKKDLKALEGTWVLSALEVNGVDVPLAKLDGSILEIKGDVYTILRKDKRDSVTLKLNPAKSPKEMDMIPQEGDRKDKVLKGIYMIEKDTFKFCRGLNHDQDRPGVFATWPNTNYFVATWKRKG